LDYVYKEKGKYKREGQLITQQSLSLSNGFREITIKKNNEPKEAMKLENHGQAYEPIIERSDYDLPPLDTDAIINMYAAFEEKKSPAYVTAKYGFRPDISLREYQRFLTMNSRDPFDLQDKITAGLSNVQQKFNQYLIYHAKAIC